MGMNLNTKEITTDEFMEFTGIDLTGRIKGGDNPSDAAQAFLRRESRRLETFIDAERYRKMSEDYPNMTDDQKDHYKHALIEQCAYVLRNGEISTDSGYDPEKGEVASNGTLTAKSIAPNAIRELKACGIWSRFILNRGRNCADGWPWWN